MDWSYMVEQIRKQQRDAQGPVPERLEWRCTIQQDVDTDGNTIFHGTICPRNVPFSFNCDFTTEAEGDSLFVVLVGDATDIICDQIDPEHQEMIIQFLARTIIVVLQRIIDDYDSSPPSSLVATMTLDDANCQEAFQILRHACLKHIPEN